MYQPQGKRSGFPQDHHSGSSQQGDKVGQTLFSPIGDSTPECWPPREPSTLHVYLGNANNDHICCIDLKMLQDFFLWSKKEHPEFVGLFVNYTQRLQLQRAVVEKIFERYPRSAKELDESSIGYWPLLLAVFLDPRENLRTGVPGSNGRLRFSRLFPSYSLDVFMDLVRESHNEEL